MSMRGITLIELTVVLSVIVVLAASLGFSYGGWREKYEVELTTKELYSDLMFARVMAMEKRRKHILVISTNQYVLFEDKNGNGEPDPGEELPSYPKKVKFELNWNNGSRIFCDQRGLIDTLGTAHIVSDTDPDYDCLKVSRTRVIMGKYFSNDKDSPCKID